MSAASKGLGQGIHLEVDGGRLARINKWQKVVTLFRVSRGNLSLWPMQARFWLNASVAALPWQQKRRDMTLSMPKHAETWFGNAFRRWGNLSFFMFALRGQFLIFDITAWEGDSWPKPWALAQHWVQGPGQVQRCPGQGGVGSICAWCSPAAHCLNRAHFFSEWRDGGNSPARLQLWSQAWLLLVRF